MIDLVFLITSLLLVAACGIFVAAEFALLAVNRQTVERLAARGDKKATGVLHALQTLSIQLSGAQVGITITNLGIGFLAEPVIAGMLYGPLQSIGVPKGSVSGIAILIGISIATIITMIFGELVPKNLAISKPLGTARFIERPQRFFTAIMKHPIRVLNNSANALLRLVNVEPQEELASARSADELISLVRRSAEKGTLPQETAQLVERSINFGDHAALDVMTPRVRVRAIQVEATVTDMLSLARKTGLSRFPVFAESLDKIVGIVHIKHAIGIAHEDRSNVTVRQVMRPPVVVPSSLQLEPLLEALREGGLQMAVVIDEFGGTNGIVTIEDLLEELVGEVHDEHDRSRQPIRKHSDSSWMISGLLRPDEIGEVLDIFLPEEDDFETVAGLITDRLEHIASRGESVFIDAVDREGASKKVLLKVERMDGRRIDRVIMTLLQKESDMEQQS